MIAYTLPLALVIMTVILTLRPLHFHKHIHAHHHMDTTNTTPQEPLTEEERARILADQPPSMEEIVKTINSVINELEDSHA